MDAGDAERTRLKLRHLLAGLEAGVLGSVFMIVWFMIASRLARGTVWEIPNLFAAAFHGPGAYAGGYVHSSWSGLALILAICGFGGLLWGVLWRDQRPAFLPFLGALAGLAVYFLFFGLIWKSVNPLIPIYAPTREVQIGYILWGLALARSPRFSRAIARANGEIAFQEAEIRTGEVMR
jgi:hypothetical protein